jgi:hypothetical protein
MLAGITIIFCIILLHYGLDTDTERIAAWIQALSILKKGVNSIHDLAVGIVQRGLSTGMFFVKSGASISGYRAKYCRLRHELYLKDRCDYYQRLSRRYALDFMAVMIRDYANEKTEKARGFGSDCRRCALLYITEFLMEILSMTEIERTNSITIR